MDYYNKLTDSQKKMAMGGAALLFIIIVASIMGKKEEHESFALASNTVTNKQNLTGTQYYRKGTLKAGVTSTEAAAYNNGAACTEYPSTIYVPVTNAVCNLFPGTDNKFTDARNMNAYVAVDETQEVCGYTRGTKVLSKKPVTNAEQRAAFNSAVTTTAANGGLDCYAQFYAALPATQEFGCTSNIDAVCTFTDLNTYQFADGSAFTAESRDKCPNNQKTVSLRTATAIDAATTSGGATVRTRINNGKSCSQQVASNTAAYPASKTVPCTSAIDAVCSPQTANVETNYDIATTDTNVKTGTQWAAEPFAMAFARAQENFRNLERFYKERFTF